MKDVFLDWETQKTLPFSLLPCGAAPPPHQTKSSTCRQAARPSIHDLSAIAHAVARATDRQTAFESLIGELSQALNTRACILQQADRGWMLVAQTRGGLGVTISDLQLALGGMSPRRADRPCRLALHRRRHLDLDVGGGSGRTATGDPSGRRLDVARTRGAESAGGLPVVRVQVGSRPRSAAGHRAMARRRIRHGAPPEPAWRAGARRAARR